MEVTHGNKTYSSPCFVYLFTPKVEHPTLRPFFIIFTIFVGEKDGSKTF